MDIVGPPLFEIPLPPLPQTLKPSLADRCEALARGVLASLLLALPLFLWPQTHDQFELPKLVMIRMASVVALSLTLAAMALRGIWVWRRSALDYPMLAWALWLVVGTLSSVSPALSWRGEYENFAGSLTQLNYVLLFALTSQLLRERRQAQFMLGSFYLGALITALYALAQALHMDPMAWSASSIVEGRYFASMGNPNFLGAMMVMALGLWVSLALESPQESATRKLRPRIYGLTLAALAILAWLLSERGWQSLRLLGTAAWAPKGSALAIVLLIALAGLRLLPKFRALGLRSFTLAEGVLLLIALAGTGTRGAYLGLLAIAAFWAVAWALRLRQTWQAQGQGQSLRGLKLGLWVGIALLSVSLLSLSLGSGLRQRLAYTLANPVKALKESRFEIWGTALRIAGERPLLGTGVDTFKTVFPQHSTAQFALYDGDNVSSRNAHSELLQILATQGIPGLVIWLWLLFAAARTWRARWKEREQNESLAWLALASLLVGYQAQNLVSFGVAAISSPFFMALACLGLSQNRSVIQKKLELPKGLLLLALTLLCVLGLKLASATWQADTRFHFANLVHDQNRSAHGAKLEEAAAQAGYALEGLRAFNVSKLPHAKALQAESSAWFERIRQAESTLSLGMQARHAAEPVFRKAAEALLLCLAAYTQEEGLALCPGEVKYWVYLGLTFEELAKRAPEAAGQAAWYLASQEAYEKAVRLNPRNAYYRGNLGRLFSSRALAGEAGALERSRQYYDQAITLAPVTRLFYENMMALYAALNQEKLGLQLIDPLKKKEPRLAARLAFFNSTALWQSSREAETKKFKPLAKTLLLAAFESVKLANELDPGPADYAYGQGLLLLSLNDLSRAKTFFSEALKRDPQHGPTRNIQSQLGL